MLKILIGGSPCTHWSIAKGAGRETQAEGIGWELFRNFLIAKEKFKPHFFLYENNKSIDPAIKRQISRELRVPLQHINSALVSAQNRERFYAHNFGDVPLPADKGIVLQDILESGVAWIDKSYTLTTRCAGAIPEDTLKRHRHTMVAEPVEYIQPDNSDIIVTDKGIRCQRRDKKHSSIQGTQVDFPQGKARTLATNHTPMTTIRVCRFNKGSQGDRIYSVDGKAICISANGGGGGAKTGLYACPIPINTTATGDKARTLRSSYFKDGLHNIVMNDIDKKTAVAQPVESSYTLEAYGKPIYEVRHGFISIKKKLYKIKLPDGFYVIRKLSVVECARLQTMPDFYCRAVSPTQGYRGLGNGWTADIIIHLLSHALRNVPRNEPLVVLSMYDGIGTGRYCFDKMGFTNVSYHAYEIDKWAITVAMSNFNDIQQNGDAFKVRDDDFSIST